MFQGGETTLLYCLDEGALQMSARRLTVAAAVLSAEGEPTFFFEDQRAAFLSLREWVGEVAA